MSESNTSTNAWRWRPGPGLLVTAAFIGPGTVTTASRAGAQFGFALLWTLLLAVAATIVLQEMAARLGLVTRRGLAEAIRQAMPTPAARRLAVGLVFVAIVLGNTAYQTGNLTGAGMGLAVLTGVEPRGAAAGLGLAVAAVLAVGATGRVVQAGLIAIVLAMSVAFLAAAGLAAPDPSEVARGALAFRLPDNGMLTALALVGTTIVPYNLFLHATAAAKRWPGGDGLPMQLRAARLDTALAITLGGLVTMAIMATAAATFFGAGEPPGNAVELAQQLEPLLGRSGQWLFAAGLAAAGVTSAITAPLAAGYVVAGTMDRGPDWAPRAVSTGVALVGAATAWGLGRAPQETIIAAQAANGLLLPLVAVFLLWVMNRRDLLGNHRNGPLANLLGAAVLILLLGGKWLLAAG